MELKESILLKDLKIYYPNHTDKVNEIEPQAIYVYLFSVGLLIIFSFSLVFNVISISSILSAKVYSPINLLILNLSIADIVYSLGMPLFLSQMYSKNWEFGLIGCQLFILTDFIGLIVSVLTVSALSVERFFDVTEKRKLIQMNGRKTRKIVVYIYMIIVWLIAFCFSIPMISSIKLEKYGTTISCNSTWTDAKMKTFFLTKFFIIFLIPYIIITVSSIKLLVFLNRWKSHTKNVRIKLRANRISNEKLTAISNKTSVFTCSISYNRNTIEEKRNSITKKVLVSVNLENKNYSQNGLYKNSNISKSVPVIMDKRDSLLGKDEKNIKKYKSFYFNIKNEASMSNENCFLTRLKGNHSIENMNEIQFAADKIIQMKKESGGRDCLVKFLKNVNYLFGLSDCFAKRKFDNERSYNVNSIRVKASRLVLIIILLFLLQWSPLWIFQLIMLFTKKEISNVQLINLVITTLSYSNTVANPALYMLITYNFKQYCQKSYLLKRIRNSIFLNNF